MLRRFSKQPWAWGTTLFFAAIPQVHAQSFQMSQCRAHIPQADLQPQVDPNAPFTILADYVSASQGGQAKFSGNVEFSQGGRSLRANETVLDEPSQTLHAKGEIYYQDAQVAVRSDSLSADVQSNRASLDSASYQLLDQQGRGQAHNLQVENAQTLSLEKASYTACPPGDVSWEIRAERIDIDINEQWATTRNASVRLFDVPVLYLPYFSYPIGGQRHTGFLFPKVSTSTTNGLDIQTPYYWNIAPNFDATLTPRFMSKRGLALQSEFRYLVSEHEGIFNVDFLNDDRDLDRERYLLNWGHEGRWQRHWRLYTDYTQISDDNYFNDFGDRVGKESENQLLQHGSLSYHQQNWFARLTVQDFQILGDADTPHQLMPQLDFSGDWPLNWQHARFGFRSELSHFNHTNKDFHTATRWHMEPSLHLPYRVPAGFFSADLALLYTYYDQNGGIGAQESYLDERIHRTLPRLSLHGGLSFERETVLLYPGHTQTLEPQVKYLYIPYDNQGNIGLYDTDELQQDYYGLFRNNPYSGLDRISDANQLTVGVSTRVLGPNNREALRISLGQIFYLNTSRVTLLRNSEVDLATNSVLALEADSHLGNNWYTHLGFQLDTDENQFNKTNAAIEWRKSNNQLAQLNYRYSRANETMVSDVDQLGTKLAWPLHANVNAVGSYYYDLNLNRSIENYLGLQFNSCCWALRLSYDRRLKSNFVENSVFDRVGSFDSSIRLDFEILGLGGRDTSGSDTMLNDGTFKYGRPFYLNE